MNVISLLKSNFSTFSFVSIFDVSAHGSFHLTVLKSPLRLRRICKYFSFSKENEIRIKTIDACFYLCFWFMPSVSLLITWIRCGSCTWKMILNITRRKTRLNKAARSFTALTLKSDGQYYNVNSSIFMDWCDNGINHVVNLLVSF